MTSSISWKPNTYPPARRSDHVDVYKSETEGEVRVPDPYNWLESQSDETEAWTTAQESYTRKYLDQIEDREKLEQEIRANTDYAKFSAPGLRFDGRWYWYYNSGLQAQYVMYRSKDKILPDFSKDVDAEVFFDNNLLAEDGTATVATSAFSRCGKFYAYGVSRSGSDFCTIYIRSTDSPLALKTDGTKPSHDDGRLSDEIRFVKFSSIVWTHDSKGFFYQRYPERRPHGAASGEQEGIEIDSDTNATLHYHRLGTSQEEDILVMKNENEPEWMWSVGISEEDGRYLELYINRDTSRKNLLWVTDLRENEIGPNMKWVKLIDEFESSYTIEATFGSTALIRTNKDAPKYKIVSVDLASESKTFKDVILEDTDALLKQVHAVQDDKILLVYQRNVKDELYAYNRQGKKESRLAEEFIGSMSVSGSRIVQREVFITQSGFTSPGTVVKYDIDSAALSTYRETTLKGLNTDDFVADQVWYQSKDGTKIPMFIVKHKSTPTDGSAPALQYGYGGFNISITPSFSPAVLTFLKAYGALYAVANIRGGSEFGEDWHLAGTRERKHNCFDDFVAATEYLVESKHAARGRVAINGGSNGGLLVAASVNRAPEGTFGAAVAEVGVLDLLKFHRFTIGRAWTSDYGNPDVPEDFDFIHPISPLHNVPKDRVLPPTILLTADHDDRVVPLHSFKHAATLQYTLPHNPHPLLLRVDKKAGHGAGKSTEQRVKEQADKYSFVAHALGLSRK